MIVYPVAPSDLDEILVWRHRRALGPWPERWLSDAGFWVPGFAAAWLVTTNAGRCFIEDAISNPDADRERAHLALDAVEKRISEVAKAYGFRYILGTTMLPAVRARVELAGYDNSEPVFSIHSKRLE